MATPSKKVHASRVPITPEHVENHPPSISRREKLVVEPAADSQQLPPLSEDPHYDFTQHATFGPTRIGGPSA
jgi:hypothetical protein